MSGEDFNRLVAVLERIATALETQGKAPKPTAQPRKRGRTLADMVPADVAPEDIQRAVDVARASGFVTMPETKKARA